MGVVHQVKDCGEVINDCNTKYIYLSVPESRTIFHIPSSVVVISLIRVFY